MNKKILVLAVLAAGACMATGAQARDLTGWFINGGVGSAHYDASAGSFDGSDSGTSFQFNGGWRSQFIGIEGGYVDLGSISENDGAGSSAKLSGKGWTLGVNGHFNPTEKWYISARAGLFRWTTHASVTVAGDGEGGATYASGSDNGTNGYFGLGTGVDFNRHWSLGANADYYQINGQGYDIHTKVYSVNLEYRF